MTSDALHFIVPSEPGRTKSIVLAMLVHAALFAFLWIGINWVSETPQSIDPDYVFTQPELDNTPPPPPVPVPTPKVEDQTPPVPDPDIAIAQAKQKKLELERAEQEKIAQKKQLEKQQAEEKLKKEEQEKADKKREEDEKKQAEKKQQEQDQKLAKKLHDQDVARMKGEAAGGNPGASSPTAPGKPGKGDANWSDKVQAKVLSQIHFSRSASDNPDATAQFSVKLLPDGSVASVRLTKSSGITAFDEAVERAINAAAPYPSDNTGTVPREFTSADRLGDQK